MTQKEQMLDTLDKLIKGYSDRIVELDDLKKKLNSDRATIIAIKHDMLHSVKSKPQDTVKPEPSIKEPVVEEPTKNTPKAVERVPFKEWAKNNTELLKTLFDFKVSDSENYNRLLNTLNTTLNECGDEYDREKRNGKWYYLEEELSTKFYTFLKMNEGKAGLFRRVRVTDENVERMANTESIKPGEVLSVLQDKYVQFKKFIPYQMGAALRSLSKKHGNKFVCKAEDGSRFYSKKMADEILSKPRDFYFICEQFGHVTPKN